MRPLLTAAVVFVFVFFLGVAHADVPRDPLPQRPEHASPPPKPSPTPEKNAGKSCGVGAGLVLLGIGVFGAWRLSTPRRRLGIALARRDGSVA